MKKKIAVTIGDPAGIGPEIVVKALTLHPEIYKTSIPIVFGHVQILKQAMHVIGQKKDIIELDNLNQSTKFNDQIIYCFNTSSLETMPETGEISAPAGKLAFKYIANSIDQAKEKTIDAIATAPINKEALKLAKVPYLDHTEILTKLTKSTNTMTLFVTNNLRVFFYSRHIYFKNIADELDKNRLIQSMEQCIKYLEQIGVENPKLALAALNPHGGEHGMFGSEEIDILIPAVEEAKNTGLSVEGPIPADSVFHLAKEGHYDAVLSLYHDQGHIAAKTYDFYHTISLTMGLPFLRTSVDHGTAMEMAGKNTANEISMVEAIKAAAKYAW